MTVLEIVATVVLCLIGLCLVLLWGQVMLLSCEKKNDNQESPSKKEDNK